ncbi:MAG: SdrD B-like domain-containing protein [Clostridia bacterium]
MKNKILKLLTVILVLATLTATNFIYVGVELVSYATSNIATNHQNVEFDAQLKEGNILSLQINVKKEGYLNGEIALEDSNFSFVTDQSNNYINKIETNKIVLNQLNAGATAQIDLKIEPVNKEIFDAGLLSAVSKLNLSGIYRDSTEKDINIKSSREVKYEYSENNTNESVENSVEVITNKVMKVSGEDKRVVQLEMNLGLKENNYPIKAIELKMNIPSVDGEYPTIVKKIDFNTMTHYDYNYENSIVEVKFTNEPNEQNKILWKKQGNEKVVLTLIYDKDATPENAEYENIINDSAVGQPNVKVTLYNEKEISSVGNVTFEDLKEEKDAVVQVTAKNSENTIYKGKLYAGIDRQYESRTNIAVNLANVEQYIDIKENVITYTVEDKEVNANVVYNKTSINKEDFDKIFGQNGILTIANENGEIIATVDNQTPIDENKNIVIDYMGKEPTSIEIKTTTPVSEGNLSLTHTRTIKEQNRPIIEKATELNTTISYEYDTGVTNNTTTSIKLEESKTEARLEVNKDTLSTVVENNVEIKTILKGNNEQCNLYSNPSIKIELPEEVEDIKINSIDLIYETELKVKNYDINGSTLTIYLEGKQTGYKDLSIEGAVLVINSNIIVNKKSATKDSQITMTYNNEGTTGTDSKSIRIVAPTDVTTINSIKDLGVETIGQEELKSVTLQRGTSAKQLEAGIEVINNNENEIQNVKVLGTFPTENDENNIATKIVEGISVQGIEEAKVYYTENENATDDLQNVANAWTEEITDSSKVSRYLIEVPSMQSQDSLQASYTIEVPALLEYNQTAEEGYSVAYTNSLTTTENEMKATTIELQTGVGPVLETKLIPSVGGKEVAQNSTVKNGEVIKYKIEVSNVGSEDIQNIAIKGNVPEGTTLVAPQDNYEYTGSSYYKELDSKTYEATLNTLKVGQVVTGEYEVRVNTGVQAGTKLSNIIQAKYGDVTKQSNESQLVTANGNVRVSVKRVTDRSVDLYEAGTVQYFAIIENISNEKQENVTVTTNLSDNLEVNKLTLITGMESQEVSDDDLYRTNSSQNEVETREISESELTGTSEESSVKTEELNYNTEVNIGSIEAGETKVLSYDILINNLEGEEGINFSVSVKNGNDEYNSNILTENVKEVDISLAMTTNTQSQYVKSGDVIEYYITVKNNGSSDIEGIRVVDSIPNSLTVNRVSFDDEEIEQLKGTNSIEILCNIVAGSESTIKIETVVNYSAARTSAEAITNVAYAEVLGDKVATTSEVNHIIEADAEDNNGGQGNNTDSDIANGTKMITGVAWFDENANGKKDDDEQLLSNIKVHLLNTTTNNLVKDENGNVLEATTNDNGVYVLDKIGNGKYIVVFEYDHTKYALTKYKAENVEESKNSDAMTSELSIENEKQQVASTDIIEINNDNVSNINIGLMELQDFSFRLDKYVSRILIQNSAGTTVKEYDNASVAKAELDSKKVDGTTVIIEYKIKVTNIGDVDGYVRKIVDYMPSDLKFSSELNTDWYQSGDNLYNISLANEKITAGQSREVTLTLTKSMTEDNTGLINNTAEIAESYNELGLADSKSTSGNKVQGEEDYSSADAILSLKTGGEIYIAIAIIVVAALGITAFIMIRKRQNNGDKK